MGFFTRRKREFDVDAVKVPEVTYPNLEAALQSVTNAGAKDTKTVSLTWEDGTHATAVVHGKTLKYINHNLTNQDLHQILVNRVKTSREEIVPEAMDTLARLLSDEEVSHVSVVEQVDEVSPKLAAFMNMVLGEIGETQVSELYSHGLIVEVEADWAVDFNPVFMQRFTGIDIDVDRIAAMVKQGENKLSKAMLFTQGEPLDKVLVEKVGDTSGSLSEEEYLVLDLLEEDESVSLSDLHDRSVGYDWTQVLNAVDKLMLQEVIDVNFTDKKQISLPDLGPVKNVDEENEDTASVAEDVADDTDAQVNLEESEIEITSVEDSESREDKTDLFEIVTSGEADDDDDFSFSMPDDQDILDEGGFGFTDEEEELSTSMVDSDLRPLVNRIVRESTNVDQSVVPVLVEEIEYNSELEAGVLDLDEKIAEVREKYHHDLGIYNNLALDIIGDQVQKGEDVTLADAGEPVDQARVDVNDEFFTLEDYEHRRYNLNSTRIGLLKSILEKISLLDGDHVQECINLIEMKIQGAENVTDTAFHSPKDDEEIAKQTDLSLLESVLVKKTVDDTEAPLFYEVVKTIGYNPLTCDSTE